MPTDPSSWSLTHRITTAHGEIEVSARIEARLPKADRVVIPAAGHFSPEDQPAAVAAALVEFLS